MEVFVREEIDRRFRHDLKVTAPTEFFLPAFQYPKGCRVDVSDGSFELDPAAQLLVYRHTQDREIHRMRVMASD